MVILSLYPLPAIAYTHDGSATLISEGNVLYSYEEEKLSRFQHAVSEFPEKAAVVAFQQTGIHPDQVESLVVTSIENCLARPDFPCTVCKRSSAPSRRYRRYMCTTPYGSLRVGGPHLTI